MKKMLPIILAMWVLAYLLLAAGLWLIYPPVALAWVGALLWIDVLLGTRK